MAKIETDLSRVFSSLEECPSEDTLRLFFNKRLSQDKAIEVRSHISKCQFCSTFIDQLPDVDKELQNYIPLQFKPNQKIEKLLRDGSERLSKILHKRNPRPRFGQVWLTKTNFIVPMGNRGFREENRPGLGRAVLVLSSPSDSLSTGFPAIQVAPLSDEVHYATDLDLLLPEETNPLGYKAMIEFWNINPMLAINLRQFVGEFKNPGLLKQIKLMWKQAVGIKVAYSEIKKVPTGDIVFSPKDPRVQFRQREIESTAYLREPVEALIELAEAETASKPEGVLGTAIELGQKQLKKIKEFVEQFIASPKPAPQPVPALVAFKKEKLTATDLLKRPKSILLFDKEADWQLKGKLVFRDNRFYLYITGADAPKITRVTMKVGNKTKGTETLNRESLVANVAQYVIPERLIRIASTRGMTIKIYFGRESFEVKVNPYGRGK